MHIKIWIKKLYVKPRSKQLSRYDHTQRFRLLSWFVVVMKKCFSHRRSQMGAMAPTKSLASSDFVLWEAAYQTKILLLAWSQTSCHLPYLLARKNFLAGYATVFSETFSFVFLENMYSEKIRGHAWYSKPTVYQIMSYLTSSNVAHNSDELHPEWIVFYKQIQNHPPSTYSVAACV